MGDWSIQVTYDAWKDDDVLKRQVKIRARSVFQTEATCLPEAYAAARLAFRDHANVKFGAILPGLHAPF